MQGMHRGAIGELRNVVVATICVLILVNVQVESLLGLLALIVFHDGERLPSLLVEIVAVAESYC